jgi:hypothetical protein
VASRLRAAPLGAPQLGGVDDAQTSTIVRTCLGTVIVSPSGILTRRILESRERLSMAGRSLAIRLLGAEQR